VARNIQAQQEMEHSFGSARKKQFKMLPDPPEVPGWEFACYYDAAETLSGDFYDFIKLSDHEIGVVVGDVTGHGLEAAMVMALAKKAIEILSHGQTSPTKIMQLANDNLIPDLDDMTFVSVFYGIINTQTFKMTHVRAGHNPTLLMNPAREEPIMELKPRGIVVGMQQGEMFNRLIEEHEIQLQPGDVVIQYTDGIIEAKNRASEEYGKDRFNQVLFEHCEQPLEKAFEAVVQSFLEFSEGLDQEDDVTLVGFRVPPDVPAPAGEAAAAADTPAATEDDGPALE
jgi:serine phosphatase RsbU (regulator of sigma subunit)